jgi:hypothetical protein
VGRALAAGGRAEDPLATEHAEHRLELARRGRRVLGEIDFLMRDLRARRRHEVVEHARGERLLIRRQRGERPFQVLLDDPPRSAEAFEDGQAEDA